MKSVAYKILENHLVEGIMSKGESIKIKIDTTLTQDATGTMTYLQLESMGIDRVKTDKSISYVDHNTLQNGFMNADDHVYLQTVANRHGIYFSKAGNGICHQVQLERFAKPGQTLLGSDSHTPTAGAMGMIAIGAGGLDVACAMAGLPFTLKMPEIVNVKLSGNLKHGVSAKDIILKVLQILTVKGGVGKIIEYSGEGIKNLSVPQRSTITNMGAELGVTTSVFPSDEQTRLFLEKQGRESDYCKLQADADAFYDNVLEINLDELEPLVAAPHSPDNIKTVKELEGKKIDQVCIGSCTNSSYTDLCTVANILKGKKIDDNVSLSISFGSKQVLEMLAQSGALNDLLSSGARILEATCGACIGMGQSPKTDAVSLRTFNRNFYGRSGTMSAGIFLVSPETAAASALSGRFSSAIEMNYENAHMPESFIIDDSMILVPDCDLNKPIIKGPNIKDLPIKHKLDEIIKKVVIKVEDNITTDHIMPAGAKVLPFRSNIEKISEFCFSQIDESFGQRCKENHGGIIIAKDNYGQGSSREHAALAPMYLGIEAVIAKSYARIHQQNLINFGIIPATFINPNDYELIDLLDELEFVNVINLEVDKPIEVINKTKKYNFIVNHNLTSEQIEIIKQGGLLNWIKSKQFT